MMDSLWSNHFTQQINTMNNKTNGKSGQEGAAEVDRKGTTNGRSKMNANPGASKRSINWDDPTDLGLNECPGAATKLPSEIAKQRRLELFRNWPTERKLTQDELDLFCTTIEDDSPGTIAIIGAPPLEEPGIPEAAVRGGATWTTTRPSAEKKKPTTGKPDQCK